MRGAWILFRRELAGLFLSPLAWVLLWIALLANGAFFALYVSMSNGDVTASLQMALGQGWPFWALLVVLPPLLTMRLLSEEARSGTLEYLLTAPVTDAGVVLGKFLAATVFMAFLWLSVPIYAVTVQLLGVQPDWGGLMGGYLGAVLASGLFVAIGMLTSSLTVTPILAAFLGFVACLAWLALPWLANLAIAQLGLLLSHWPEVVERVQAAAHAIFDKMSVTAHFQDSFLAGVLDTAEVVFFLSWIAFFLFLTVRTLEMRRWRG